MDDNTALVLIFLGTIVLIVGLATAEALKAKWSPPPERPKQLDSFIWKSEIKAPEYKIDPKE